MFIHIGMNKTGTSTIQKVLSEYRPLLKSHGLLYPQTGCSGHAHHEISGVLGFHHDRPSEPGPAEQIERLRKRLVAEIEESGCRQVVISSEFFTLSKPLDAVRNFFSGFDCRIVVYLRRHDYWWAAAYHQAVKSVVNPPWHRGFDAFFKWQRHNNPQFGKYRQLIVRWAKAFGDESMVVRPYERAQNQPDLVTDFLRALDREDLAELVSPKVSRENVSLGARETYLIDIMQRAQIAADSRLKIIEYVIRGSKGGAAIELLSPEVRRRLVDDNAADYQFIARKYLRREDGRLFLEGDPDPKEPWTAPLHPRFMDVVETVVAAIKS